MANSGTQEKELIVFLERATIPPKVNLRRPKFAHDWADHDRTKPAQIPERVKDATILVINKATIGEEQLAAMPKLKLIAVAATGSDRVDIKAASKRGIVVSNIRGYAKNTVPEHAFALILALRRSIVAYQKTVAAGAWQKAEQFCYFDHPIDDLAGQTLGLFGTGAIGGSVGRIAEAFGMRVLKGGRKGAAQVPAGYTPFDQVIAESDVITLHCPMTPETRGMIGKAEFARMTRKPLIINTARGGLVDEAALVEALKAGQIAGAGIDVVTSEPPPADHPFMALVGTPNFILTPHTGWAGTQAIQTLADQLIDNIEAFHAGQPRNVVS